MAFRIHALDAAEFSHLFGSSQEELAEFGARRVVADSKPGFPCRVSLQDAEIGESLLLLNYEHQPMPTPFRSSHAIYVREHASRAAPGINVVPDMFRHRLMSVRAFDAAGMMVDAEVVDGAELEMPVERMLANRDVDYLHLHNAVRGCYAALVRRVSPG